MCKNRRDAVIAAIREHLPITFISKHIFVGTDGKSKEGYSTEFKRTIGKLLDQTTPPFTPAEVASVVGVDARCIMLWLAKYRRGHFNKDTPRDKVYAHGGKLTIVSVDDYRKVQHTELLQFSKANNLTDEQFKNLSSAMESMTEKNYTSFRENDGDWENLIDYLELIFMEYVTDPNNEYQDIKTVEEVVEDQPILQTIDSTKQRIDRVVEHWNAIKKIACPPMTMSHVRCYMLSHKPDSPEDILFSISALHDWKTKQDRNRAYARLMDYCDGYVGPHVDKKIIPLTIRNKLSKQVVLLPNNTWMVIPVKIMEYIESCRVKGTWDWEVLMLPDCPIPRMSVQMRNSSGLAYQKEQVSDNAMLFGRPIQDVNMWQYYVDLVKTMAPEAAIQTQGQKKDEPVVSVPEDMESLSSSIVDAFLGDKEVTTYTTEQENGDVVSVKDILLTEDESTVKYHITAYTDESYGGTKLHLPLDLSGLSDTADIENYLHGGIIAVLRAANPSKPIHHHDVVLIRVADKDHIHITGHVAEKLHVPMRQKSMDNSVVSLPVNYVFGCGGNRVETLHHGNKILIPYSVVFGVTGNRGSQNPGINSIILTVVDNEPLHLEFVKQ